MKDGGLLMIPGPIEFGPKALRARGISASSHGTPNLTASYYPKRVDRSVVGHINKAGITLASKWSTSASVMWVR